MLVVFPVHPRTNKCLQEYGMWERLPANIIITEPLGYLDMLKLMRHSSKVLTDSGGIQKEAYILRVPCITLRENTEWVETVEEGGNVLVGVDEYRILDAILQAHKDREQKNIFSDVMAAHNIVRIITLTGDKE
jgi:UDP-GlcNAc3NAcA epimerase